MRWSADRHVPATPVPGRVRRPAPRLGRLALALVLLVGGPASAWAQEQDAGWSPGPVLEERVRRLIAERWGVEPRAVRLDWGTAPRGRSVPDDARVRLLGSGSGGGWVASFEVPGSRGGALSVRVRAGTVRREPVAARRLARGAVLEAPDIDTVERVRWGPPVDDGPGVAPGWVARRALAVGEVLRPPAVEPPPVVRAGEPVDVVWRRGGIQVTVRGRAIRSAASGERVIVRTETGRRLRGIAREGGIVRVDEQGKGS